MSRDDGFAVMDVSTDIANDPKFRRLARHAPENLGAAFIGYVATMAESWKAGRRVTVEDAWPNLIPFDRPAAVALTEVGLLDRAGKVPIKAWSDWFGTAKSRRDKSRDRWARYNAQRNADTAQLPRGSDVGTASSVPPVPPVPPVKREIPPPPTSGGRREDRTNPRATGEAPRQRRANPRANGVSERQVRNDRKRGPTALAAVLREAMSRPDHVDDGADRDEPDWIQPPEPAS